MTQRDYLSGLQTDVFRTHFQTSSGFPFSTFLSARGAAFCVYMMKMDTVANEKGEVIAEALGDKDVLLLANHGCIVVGRSISQAMEDVCVL